MAELAVLPAAMPSMLVLGWQALTAREQMSPVGCNHTPLPSPPQRGLPHPGLPAPSLRAPGCPMEIEPEQ